MGLKPARVLSAEISLPSEELLHEQAYLVSRGVRPLSLARDSVRHRSRRRRRERAPAESRWAVDLYEWKRDGRAQSSEDVAPRARR